MRYDLLAQEALRGVIKAALRKVVKLGGLPGEHHFYIAFNTTSPGVRLSETLKQRYPREMTIILQHQYWNLVVSDDEFEVELSFNDVPERLVIPFSAVKGFLDPSVQFGLQFETVSLEQEPPLRRRAVRHRLLRRRPPCRKKRKKKRRRMQRWNGRKTKPNRKSRRSCPWIRLERNRTICEH
jgi:hypothetical protein